VIDDRLRLAVDLVLNASSPVGALHDAALTVEGPPVGEFDILAVDVRPT
jgi:hypothetical protein